MNAVVGILLAAGEAKRFGADKRRQPLPDGTPMALRSAENLIRACPASVAVLRPGDDGLAHALRALGLTIVFCADAAQGMGRSLAAGAAAGETVSAASGGWLIALADMPFIADDSYQQVMAAMSAGAALARPTYRNRPGHPVGFSREFYAELLALSGDEGGRAILSRHAERLVLCPVTDGGVVHDVDQPLALRQGLGGVTKVSVFSSSTGGARRP